jgi:uncharacterized protein (DUF1800 family)
MGLAMHHNRIVPWGGWVAGLALSLLVLAPAHADPKPTRQEVQHLLRRFAFSASPAAVNKVISQGIAAWLNQQMNWQAIDDSKSMLDKPPTAYVNPNTCNYCLPNYNAFEALVYQHDLLTDRQLQAKLELHWLDHFSVNMSQIDPPNMYNYDAAVRENALGNFAKLVTAVALSPAMMSWLTNEGNQANGPNVNFARELMQLYTIGEWKLNQDGSQVLDKHGQPIPNYGEADIKPMAKAMSGYNTVFLKGGNPMKNYLVTFDGQYQIGGKVSFLGAQHDVPRNSGAIAYIVKILARHPSTAPFQVTELLKRFATETPSPKFISDIVAVWNANVDAPDQIAQVVKAIINHPQFDAAYHAMPKQPIELVLGAMRQLPGKMQAAAPKNCSQFQPYQQAGQSLEGIMSGLNQDIFFPPNVFSFYIPGHVETMMTTSAYVGQTAAVTRLLYNSPPQSATCTTGADTWIDVPALLATIGSTNGQVIANYLLDALVDGGSPKMRSVIVGYLGKHPSNAVVQGAVWLILNSPEYAVN